MGTVSITVNPFIFGISLCDILRIPDAWLSLRKITLVLAFKRLRLKDLSQLMSKGAHVVDSCIIAPDKFYLSVEATCEDKATHSGEEVTFSANVEQISTWY